MLTSYTDNATYTAISSYMELATACYGSISCNTSAHVTDRDVFITASGVRDFSQVCAICEGVCGFEPLYNGARVATYRVPVLEVRIAVYLD